LDARALLEAAGRDGVGTAVGGRQDGLYSRAAREDRFGAGKRAGEGELQLPLEHLGGGDRAALVGRDRLDSRTQLLGDGVRAVEIAERHALAVLEAVVVAGGYHQSGVDVSPGDGLLKR